MLSDVTVLITTFMRPGYVQECLRGIDENLRECEISVACDDAMHHPHYMARNYATWTNLPFDSGLTAKRNAAVKEARTKYCLLACDDFNFYGLFVRYGVEKMVETLETYPQVDVAVGRVNNKEYEGHLEYVPGEYIREYRIRSSSSQIIGIDIGINYFLARTEILREVPWDESIRPIGGEHVDWFLSMKQAGKKVVFVPGCNIETIEKHPEWQDPRYSSYRWRAQEGHRLMMKKWGINEYFGFGEQV